MMKLSVEPVGLRANPASMPAPRARNYCVLVADASRARFWVLDAELGGDGPAIAGLFNVAEITNPMLRARDVERVSDGGAGRRRRASGPLHATPYHHEHHHHEVERYFAAQIAEEAAGVWRRYPSCELIVAAPAMMLSLLGPAIQEHIRANDQIHVQELPRNLTKLIGPALHDLLAEDKRLPERDHHAPT